MPPHPWQLLPGPAWSQGLKVGVGLLLAAPQRRRRQQQQQVQGGWLASEVDGLWPWPWALLGTLTDLRSWGFGGQASGP